MNNKSLIVFLTIIISLLCIYYLSFTFVSKGIKKDAELSATTNGEIDFALKQKYLDSVWHEPIYNFAGAEFTYKEIKETELNLGLDLQGGMHVTLEVSPVEIIKGLSGNSQDEAFNAALTNARQAVKGTALNFVDEFYKAFQKEAPGRKISEVFVTTANKDRISLKSSDQEVLEMINTEVEDAIERSFNILRTRVDRFGTSQPNIQRLQGTGRIQVELPGVDNPSRVRKLLQGVAKLEFLEVYTMQEVVPTLQSINTILVKEQEAEKALNELSSTDLDDTEEKDSEEGLGDLLTEEAENSLDSALTSEDSTSTPTDVSPLFSLLRSGNNLIYEVKDTSKINSILTRKDIKALIPVNMKFLWSVKPIESEEKGIELIELNPIKLGRGGKAPLVGDVITDARMDYDERSRPAVSMQMNASGAKKWRKLTGSNIDRRIAIVLDNYVYSAPNVKGEIPNGSSSISGNFTIEEAKDLANVLKAGALPAPTTIVEESVIGPSLGKVAQKQGIMSILGGLVIVILFMVAYYHGSGLIANVALFFNVFFILGILAQFNAALTLPGIAGIVLTIGMAIDANVLIFERIKEELRNGSAIKQAISAGYSKALSSIVDANLTTFITGVILYALGQGPVKGFAITMMIGIACSFFSAVFITRVIVEFFAKKGEDSKLKFSTGLSKNLLADANFDFIGNRKKAYLLSASIILIGLGALVATGGLSLGVDFKGGRSYVVSFDKTIVPSTLKAKLKESFPGAGTEVKTFGASTRLKITTSYMVDEDTDEADSNVLATLISGIEGATQSKYTANDSQVGEGEFTISSSSKVGATIANDIKTASLKSIILSLIAIFGYILIRFRKWQFGLGAIIALFHDTLFVIAAFAIAGLLGFSFEIDQVFIAAMLTIIGYSINDTVVVFDRIRENLGGLTTGNIKEIFNTSLNSTLSRTVITSATTLIVVIILFVFGGASLKGFSFALLVGVVVGTYSSMFIATPIALDLQHKELEKGKK